MPSRSPSCQACPRTPQGFAQASSRGLGCLRVALLPSPPPERSPPASGPFGTLPPVEAGKPRTDAVERVLLLMAECDTCTGYGDPETVRIFRGVASRIREAVYGSVDPSPVLPPPERPQPLR